MNVKSAQRKYVAGTSRNPRRAATLLAQMADLERGARISELREQRHFTQSVVADRVGVTLRAYQEWEAGGGIQWENAKRLAKVLGSSPDFLMSGLPPEMPETESQLRRLDRIESKLDELVALLTTGPTDLKPSDPAAAVVADVAVRLAKAAGSPPLEAHGQ